MNDDTDYSPATEDQAAAAAVATELSPEATLETVTLKKAHTHAGKAFAAGDEIQVNPIEQQWLIENEVIAADTEGEQ